MSADHDDYQSEPIRGLPERPPAGEDILWQGEPSWRELAKNVFHIRAVAGYFAALMAWRAATHLTQGGLHASVLAVLGLLPIAALGLGLLAGLAVLFSRTTVYTITSRRVVIRTGVALTIAVNIPFRVIQSAGLRPGAGGNGDIALSLSEAGGVSYANLWPNVRPWRMKKPEPMLRGIADAKSVAALLAAAVAKALPETAIVVAAAANQNEQKNSKPATASMASPGGMRMPASVGAST
jgi:hypothetical protein